MKAADEVARVRASSKKKREGNVRYKSAAGGTRTREALLDIKSHRRINRRQVSQSALGSCVSLWARAVHSQVHHVVSTDKL